MRWLYTLRTRLLLLWGAGEPRMNEEFRFQHETELECAHYWSWRCWGRREPSRCRRSISTVNRALPEQYVYPQIAFAIGEALMGTEQV